MKKTIELSEIIVRNGFTNSVPSDVKMKRKQDYYDLNGKLDKDIVVNNKNVLLDGYINYLIAMKNNIDEIEVEVLTKTRTRKVSKYKKYDKEVNPFATYVFGVHESDESKKEYVWKLPKRYGDCDFLPGDKVVVNTKYGRKVVIVTQIKTLDSFPVGKNIKYVVKRFE